MARYRTVKPEFWTSEQVLECSPIARLMFIGMWNYADDAGRLPLSAKSIKAQVFPSDDITLDTIRGMIDELSSNSLVLVYSIDGKEYLQITGWHHQKIDRPQPGKYPAPQEEHSTTIRRMVAPEENRKEEKEEERRPVARATRTKEKYSADFETQFWKPFPRTAIMSKKEAWREWMKLAPDQRLAACKALEPYRRHLAKNPTLNAVHACRFLSQDRAEGILEIAAEKPAYDIRSSLV